MAKTEHIKIKQTKTEHTGIYVYGDIPTDKTSRQDYKFLIRQTVTIQGIGKKTVKETFTVKGMTYNKALDKARDERPLMRERAKKKVLGITDNSEKVQEFKNITLNEVWKQYVEHKTKTSAKLWSKNATRTMNSTYDNHIAPVIGKKRAIQVGYADIEKCIIKVRGKGLSARMEKGIISALRPMFTDWYKRNGLMDTKTNPAKDQETKEPVPRQVNLTWKQKEKLFKAMYTFENERFRQIWIWVSTGRRIEEVLSLKHADVDSNGYYTIIAEQNKVRKPMIHRVPDGATLPLYKGWVHSAPRDKNKQISQDTVNNQWRILRATLGLPKFNKHDIRHLIETVLTDSEVPQQTINMVLGHLETGASKHYKNDTTATADRKHRAVEFFLKKVFNKIDREIPWDKYLLEEAKKDKR